MFGAPHAPKLWDFSSITAFGVPQSYETPQCSKIPKFWGMRCTNYRNAQKCQNFVCGPQACIVYKSLGFLGFFEHYSVWRTSCPKTLGFFEHYSVWCTSELRSTAMLENPKVLGHEVPQSKHCNAQKCQNFVIYGPQACIVYKSLRF